MTPTSVRTRTAMVLLLVAGVCATGAAAAWTAVAGPTIDQAALLVALVTLDATLAMFLWPEKASLPVAELADDLACTVHEQWRDEVKVRKLREPGVLPLSWAATRRKGIADRGDDSGPTNAALRSRPRHLHGRLDGKLDQVVAQLAQDYRRLPLGRLVLLGEPGAGKSVLAVLMTLGLLGDRAPAGRVPVLLPAASWDPVSEPLDTWIVRTLAVLYYNGQPATPDRLLRNGLLLPILDGLDEIPESARRSAVAEINRVVGADWPVVVTCRSAEYTDVILGGAPVLHGAPVVEIQPLSADDVIAYLASIDWPAGTDWTAVYRHLRLPVTGDEVRPVAAALSTPLMVTMARFTYERCGGDPGELLDTTVYGSRHSVEDAIVDRVVDAAYEPVHVPAGQDGDARRWNAAQARRWLHFFAAYLHRHRDRDLAWWNLGHRLLSPWVAPGVGITGGLILFVAVVLGQRAVDDKPDELENQLSAGVSFGVLFAVLAIMIWYAAGERAPGRLSFSLTGSLGRLRRGFANGVAISAIPGSLVLAAVAVGISLDSWSLHDLYQYCQGVAMAAAIVLVTGLALAVHNWLDAPHERSARSDPLAFVRQDRRSALVGAVAAGTAVNIFAFPTLLPSAVLGTSIGQAVAGFPGWATAWSHQSGGIRLAVDVSWDEVDEPLTVAAVFLLPGVAFAGLVLLTRAWPRFVVTRFLLAAQGRIPWRLMTFLADARAKGLLRQSGGAYQFRHIRFQERLATRPPATARPGTPQPFGRRTVTSLRRRPVLIAVVVMLAGLAAVVGEAPKDTTREVLTEWGVDHERVALSTGGRRVASLATDQTVRLWRRDPGNGTAATRLTGRRHFDEPVRAVALSADGHRVAVATDGAVHVLDADSADLRAVVKPARHWFSVGHLALTPTGDHVAVSGDHGALALWNIAEMPVACDLSLPAAGPGLHRPSGAIWTVTTSAVPGLAPGPAVGRYAFTCRDQRSPVLVYGMSIPVIEDIRRPRITDDRVLFRATVHASGQVTTVSYPNTYLEVADYQPVSPPGRLGHNRSTRTAIDVGRTGVADLALSPDATAVAAVVGGSVCLWDLPLP
jgi:hypothetical protein